MGNIHAMLGKEPVYFPSIFKPVTFEPAAGSEAPQACPFLPYSLSSRPGTSVDSP